MLFKILKFDKVKSLFSVFMGLVVSQVSLAAIPPAKVIAPRYKVAMRVNLKGHSPLSINTVAKSGKKTFISQFSDDGQTETLISMYTKRSQLNEQAGLYMDVSVTKRVRGESRVSERAQFFAPDNQEMEFGSSPKGRMKGNLSLAVMAHQL